MIKQIASLAVKGRCFTDEKLFCFFPKTDVRLSLVYGANGSGKSTISRAFRTLTQETDSDIRVRALDAEGSEIVLDSPTISVFNEDYIDANVKIDDDGLGSIVLLGEQVELQTQIDTAQAQVDKEKRKLDAQKNALAPYLDCANLLSPQYHWERIRSILRDSSQWAKRDSKIRGNQIKSAVTEVVMREICGMTVRDSLDQLETDFSEKSKLLKSATTPNPAYTFPVKIITEKGDLEDQVLALLAQKLDEPVLTEREQLILSVIRNGGQGRIESAQEYFSDKGSERCPYCFQPISSEYRQGLLESIRRVMNREVDEHKLQLQSLVMEEIQDVFEQYSELDDQIVSDLRKAIQEYNNSIQQYKRAVQNKIQRVYTPVEQQKLCINDQLERINQLIRQLEKRRAEFVAATQDREQIKKDLILINKQMAQYHCRDEIAAYKKQSRERDKTNAEYQQQERVLQQAEAQLKQLLDQKKNLALAIECINESLVYVFFSKDRLSIELRNDKYFLKSRGKDVRPKNVSQGERNIIALCYFFTQIAANQELSKRYEQEQLIVIDDPVSSFDFDNKVGIASLLRREIKRIIFGNNESKVLIMTHDLSTMFDLKKAYVEIGNAAKAKAGVNKATSYMGELSNGVLQEFKQNRSEYAHLIESVFLFANGDASQEIEVGNKMRRVLEAFSTFCYRKGIDEVSCDERILKSLGEYSDYFENRMYRLVLHGESHYEEQVYSFHDSLGFYGLFSTEEKRKTARDILCFMYLLNEQHVRVYLPNAEKELKQWCREIRQSMSRTTSEKQKTVVEEDLATRTVKLYDLPLSAGLGVDAFEDVPSEDFETTNPKCDFALRIRGNSMEPDIPDGSVVLIHKQDTVETGEVGAFFHNGRVYCKKRSVENGKTLLLSNNSKYSPIEIRDEDISKCYGKVIQINEK